MKTLNTLIMMFLFVITICDAGGMGAGRPVLVEGQTYTGRNGPAASDRDFSGESLFTGDVSLAFPLADLGGISAKLTYNSNIHRPVWEKNRFQQAGWVGLGWSLSLGSIFAEINSTKDTTDDRYFYGGPNGSSELILDSDGYFKLKEYQYWKISRIIDGSGNIIGWTIKTEDGTTLRFGNFNNGSFQFDYGYRNATRFMLGWSGLVGSPKNTNYSSEQYVAYQWDLSDIEDIYGQHTTISYQVEKDSLLSNGETTTLKYTRASYPLKITDRTGASVEFILGTLGVSEYDNPYSSSTLRTVQHLYQTKFLDSVMVKSSNGTVIRSFKLNFQTATLLGLGQTKRFLTSITAWGQNGSKLPSTDFLYYGVAGQANGYNPGALKKITYAEGGSVEYTYKAQTITNARLDSTWSGAQKFSSSYYPIIDPVNKFYPASGTDFFVVPIRSGSNTYMRVHRWGVKSWYHETSFPYEDVAVTQFEVRNNFLVAKSSSNEIKVFTRAGDGWATYNVGTSSTKSVVATGQDFIVLKDGTTYSVVWLKNGVWTSTSLGSISGSYSISCGPRYFVMSETSGTRNVRVYRYNGSAWTYTSFVASSTLTSVLAGNDFFVAEISSYTIEVHKWNGTSWGDTYTDSHWPDDPTVQVGNEMFSVIAGDSVYVYSWNGNSGSGYWTKQNAATLIDPVLDLTPTFQNARVTIGGDYVAIGWYEPSESVSYLGLIRPQNGAWTSASIIKNYSGVSSSTVATPIASATGLFLELYKPYTTGVNGFVKHYVHVEKASSWEETLLNNIVVTSAGTYQYSFPGMNFLAAVIDPDSSNDGNELVKVYKQGFGSSVNNIYSGNPYDYPVENKTVQNGMGQSYTTTFTFAGGVYDIDITTAKYNKATTILPGNMGTSVSLFYNDLEDTEHEEFVSVADYKELDGYPYKTKQVDENGSTVIAQTTNTWSVHTVSSSNNIYHRRLAQSAVLADGVTTTTTIEYNDSNGLPKRVTKLGALDSEITSPRDLITETKYAFEQYPSMAAANMLVQPYEQKQAAKNNVSVSAEYGVINQVRKTFTVLYTQTVSYSGSAMNGDFRIGTTLGGYNIVGCFGGWDDVATVSGTFTANPGVTYYVEANAVACIPGKPCMEQFGQGTVTYFGGAEDIQNWTRTEYLNNLPLRTLFNNGSGWVRADSIVSRDSFGNVLETENIDGVRTSTKYGYNSTVPIATAINANASKVFVDEFGDGDYSGWTITDNGNDGDTQWVVENGMLKQTNIDTASGYENDMIMYNLGTEITGDAVFEFDLRIADSDNWDMRIGMGGDQWMGGDGQSEFAVRMFITNETWATGGGSAITTLQSGLIIGKTYHFKIVAKSSVNKADYYIDGKLVGADVNYFTSSSGIQKIIFGNFGFGTITSTWYIDNVRLYPASALVTSQSYDPNTLQVTTTTDANGVSTYPEYDGLGRLETTLATDKTVVSKQNYYYSRDFNPSFSSSDPNFVETVTYPQGLPTSGLVGHWRLEKNGIDETGNNNLNIVGTDWGRGYFGATKTFDGTTAEYAHAPLISAYQTQRPTIAMWVKLNSTSPTGTVASMSVQGAWQDGRGFKMAAGTTASFSIGTASGSWIYANGTTTLQTNTWYHLAGTYDGTYLRLYVNGVQEAANNIGSVTISYTPISNKGPNPSTFYVGIQHNTDNTSPTYAPDLAYPLNGSTDDVRVYNRSLSAAEIASLANVSVSTAYSDGLGRTLQTQATEGSNELLSLAEYDTEGRQYRQWRTFRYNSGHKYVAFSTASSAATSTFGISNPFTETLYKTDPLSRVVTTKPVGQTSTNEYINYAYSSASVDGVLTKYVETKKRLASTTAYPWVVSRTYTDKLGRTIKTASYEDGQAEDIVARMDYTMQGNIRKETAPKGGADTTTYKYDFLGRMTEKKSPDEGTSKYMYDKAGRLRFMVDSLGLTTNPDTVLYWKYDILGRVIEKGYIGSENWGSSTLQTNINNQSYPSTPATWRKKYTYAVGGRLSSLLTNNDYDTTAEVEEYFKYDKYGNIAIKEIKVIDYNASTIYSTTYTYDLLGRATGITYPASSYGTVGVTYDYDRVGRVKRVGVAGTTASFATYTYNAKAELETEVLNPDGTAHTRTFIFNNKGVLAGISNSLYSEVLTVSQVGQDNYHGLYLTASSDYGSLPGSPVDNGYTYKYDKYGRMYEALNSVNDDWSIGYDNGTLYDDNGNITSMQHGYEAPKTYTYKSGTNIIQSVGSWSYSSTVTGLLTSAGTDGVTNSITYDPFTQMTMKMVRNGTTVNLQYDGNKERVYKEVGGTKTLYLHGLQGFPLVVLSGSTEILYVHGQDGLVAARINGAWNYVFKDHLGSTKVVVNGGATVVAWYDYDPYGKIVDSYVNAALKNLFTGHELESELSSASLWNFRARQFDSQIGLFYATDPARQTYAPLGYALNNPTKFVDPTGRVASDDYFSNPDNWIKAWHAAMYGNGRGVMFFDPIGGGIVSGYDLALAQMGEEDPREFYRQLDQAMQEFTQRLTAPIAILQVEAQDIGDGKLGFKTELAELPGYIIIFSDNLDGNTGSEYTAQVLVIKDGTIIGRYDGTTLPNQINKDSKLPPNTLASGMFNFNNLRGHKGRPALNVVENINDAGNRRYVAGFTTGGDPHRMYNVNIHGGWGSEGCLTIHRDQWRSFMSHFSGSVSGIVLVSRGYNYDQYWTGR